MPAKLRRPHGPAPPATCRGRQAEAQQKRRQRQENRIFRSSFRGCADGGQFEQSAAYGSPLFSLSGVGHSACDTPCAFDCGGGRSARADPTAPVFRSRKHSGPAGEDRGGTVEVDVRAARSRRRGRGVAVYRELRGLVAGKHVRIHVCTHGRGFLGAEGAGKHAARYRRPGLGAEQHLRAAHVYVEQARRAGLRLLPRFGGMAGGRLRVDRGRRAQAAERRDFQQRRDEPEHGPFEQLAGHPLRRRRAGLPRAPRHLGCRCH